MWGCGLRQLHTPDLGGIPQRQGAIVRFHNLQLLQECRNPQGQHTFHADNPGFRQLL